MSGQKTIKKVGVVGCGMTGSAFAEVFAQFGYTIIVSELNNDLLSKGLTSIRSRLSQYAKKGEMAEEEANEVLARIKGTTNLNDFRECDLAIEAVIEKMDTKKEVFTKLDKVCPQHTILATNTSVLSVLDMAMATARPDKVMGFHTNLLISRGAVEIVKTIVTSDDTIETGKALAKSLGREYVIAQDIPGFIIGRLTASFFCNAIRLLEAGIASRDDIDTAIRSALNLPLGPLAMVDHVGLDLILMGPTALYEELKDYQYAPPTLLKKMVAAGWLGRKTGKGFYEYE